MRAFKDYESTAEFTPNEKLLAGAYVVRIIRAEDRDNALCILFDIAEGEYKDFYRHQYDRNSNEDKKWPVDGVFYLEIPGDGRAEYVITNYDTFFADLEDSNNGFVFAGDEKTLKGKTNIDHYCKKWAEKGIIVECKEDKTDLRKSTYKIIKM